MMHPDAAGIDVGAEECVVAVAPGREGTRWDLVLQTLALYRLIDPGSEWRLHRHWFDHSAIADLLGSDFTLADPHRLYACHDKLLTHKRALFDHLTGRWRDLFDAKYEVLLYDLTSTYFESDSPEKSDGLRRFGYSWDSRPTGDSQPQAARRANAVRQPQRLRPGCYRPHRHPRRLSPRLRSPARECVG